MAKLWHKDYDLDRVIEDFTVGRDYLLDRVLLPSDCLASMAQASQLHKMGLLTDGELGAVHGALGEAFRTALAGNLDISPSDEDGHTALEAYLCQVCGDAGKKIHTGRSRNDQVITAIRLYGRHYILELERDVARTALVFLDFAALHAQAPMPGRTHLQIAMPSSVGLWAAAWAEELLDFAPLLTTARMLFDQGSLGSGASYGSPLPLDREMTSRLLGFDHPQNNVLAINNSRGRYEAAALDAMDQIGITLSKWAQDLILMSLPELGYFELSRQLCSGSSIMPQKKNPDGLELLRSRSAVLSGYAQTVKNIVRSLPSGYNRDFQDTKEPFLRGLDVCRLSLSVARLTMETLRVNEAALRRAMTPDIYATDLAFEKVLGGMAFRDAYREVGLHLDELENRDPDQALKARTHLGGTANLGLEKVKVRAVALGSCAEERLTSVLSVLSNLAGFSVKTVMPQP